METVLMRGKPVADVYREAIAKKIAVAKPVSYTHLTLPTT